MADWFKRLFSWIYPLAETKWSKSILVISAFADASILPLPITAYFLILLVLNPKLIWKYILLVVIGTMAGSLFGYYLGHFAWIKPNGDFTDLARFINNNVHGFSLAVYDKIRDLFAKWNFWILCGATATPLPYGIVSISSGIFNINVLVFTITTLISQTIKYSFLAVFTNIFGTKMRSLYKPRWQQIVILAATFILIVFILSKSVVKPF